MDRLLPAFRAAEILGNEGCRFLVCHRVAGAVSTLALMGVAHVASVPAQSSREPVAAAAADTLIVI